jgi:hypothetical protein
MKFSTPMIFGGCLFAFLGGGMSWSADTRQKELLSILTLPVEETSRFDDALKQRIESARTDARAAVQLWTSADIDSDAAYNARSFLLDMEDLSIVPVLDAPLPSDPSRAALSVQLLADAESGLRRKIAVRIDRMLDDKRPIPLRPVPRSSEEQPDQSRVCDEAYLALYRLTHFGREMDRRGFLKYLSPAERDAVIARGRKSSVWRRVIQDLSDLSDEAVPPRIDRR